MFPSKLFISLDPNCDLTYPIAFLSSTTGQQSVTGKPS